MAKDKSQQAGLRNLFYRNQYNVLLKTLNIALLTILVLSCLLFYQISHIPQPSYYAQQLNLSKKLIPLARPNQSTTAVLHWATAAVLQAYSLNFDQHEQQLANVKQYFTDNGYEQFMTQLKSKGVLNLVIDRKLIISAVVSGTPVVLSREIINGRFSWRIQMPILISVESVSQTRYQTFLASLIVSRVSTLDNPKGIAIDQFFTSSYVQRAV